MKLYNTNALRAKDLRSIRLGDSAGLRSKIRQDSAVLVSKARQVTHPEKYILTVRRPFHMTSRSLRRQHASPAARVWSVPNDNIPGWTFIKDGLPAVQRMFGESFLPCFAAILFSIESPKLPSIVSHSITCVTHFVHVSPFVHHEQLRKLSGAREVCFVRQ